MFKKKITVIFKSLIFIRDVFSNDLQIIVRIIPIV